MPMMPTAPDTALDVGELTAILARLGRSVTTTPGAPPEIAAVHLARVLVAAAEQQAVAAELTAAGACGGQLPGEADVDAHQGTYDLATAEAFTTADQAAHPTPDPGASPLVRMWDLATTTGDADTDAVAALDAATALLLNTGDQARWLRAEIGLD